MSRMVRESTSGGLRERLYFARLLLDELSAGIDDGEDRSRLLALRGGVVFHLYSVLAGLLRHCARSYGVPGHEACLGLTELTRRFSDAGVRAGEITLVNNALSNPADPVHWLEQQLRAAQDTGGMARRPQPTGDELGVTLEDPDAELAPGDIERLQAALKRVDELLGEALAHGDEW